MIAGFSLDANYYDYSLVNVPSATLDGVPLHRSSRLNVHVNQIVGQIPEIVTRYFRARRFGKHDPSLDLFYES